MSRETQTHIFEATVYGIVKQSSGSLWAFKGVLDEIEQGKGRHFDPKVADALLEGASFDKAVTHLHAMRPTFRIRAMAG